MAIISASFNRFEIAFISESSLLFPKSLRFQDIMLISSAYTAVSNRQKATIEVIFLIITNVLKR